VLEPAVLAAYVRWGFRDRPDGQVELACAPASEAAYFVSGSNGGAADAFEHLTALAGRAIVVCGNRTDLPRPVFDAQAQVVGAPLVEVSGDHFFLQANTPRAASLVREHL